MADPTIEEIRGEDSSMPKTRKTLDEQLDALKHKREAIEKQLNTIEARKKETDRKLDTRRKIIIGGSVMAHSQIDPEFARALQAALEKAVAPKDRPLVMDFIRPGAGQRGEGIVTAPTAPTATRPVARQTPPQSGKPSEPARP